MDIIEKLGQLGLIPVIRIEEANQAPALVEALLMGGLPCAEITFRTEAARESIQLISSTQPEVIIGAGTVLSVTQAKTAIDAGAKFIISPGFDPKVVDWCVDNQVPVIPGIATATEALMAMERDLRVLKFFPAEMLGGIPMLEALSAALIGVRFVPTGGVTPSNIAAYLRAPMVFAVAGSWMATSKLISAGNFAEITRLTQDAVGVVRQVRQTGGKS
jgi:2-dehydro-3-deoxyphosphogluconate aldolase / (4S)-4-hydroxy-2-oxoglutarate aldolase